MPERIPWKESNLALIGSDLDHKIKEAAAQGEPQWQGIGEHAGKRVWRIEQFKVVAWPEELYGKFHKGDSYVVLNSYKRGTSDALFHDLHIWIGSESSQDEYGTAAYKMVEADDYLGGAAVQHREVQGRESYMFRKYFPYLEYLDGGVESGFNHVEATPDEPHLYRVKGTERGMSLTQVPLKKSSLNKGDSFILCANKATVWVWHGESANPDEKSRSNSVGETMCTEGTVVTLEQGSGDDEAAADFWAHLGDDGEIQDADDADEDVEEFAPLLFRLPAGGADAEPEQIAKAELVKQRFGRPQARLDKALLDPTDVFLLDAGWECFVWIGKEASREEKIGAIAGADAYCFGDPRTADLPLSIVKHGIENPDFDGFFQ